MSPVVAMVRVVVVTLALSSWSVRGRVVSPPSEQNVKYWRQSENFDYLNSVPVSYGNRDVGLWGPTLPDRYSATGPSSPHSVVPAAPRLPE